MFNDISLFSMFFERQIIENRNCELIFFIYYGIITDNYFNFFFGFKKKIKYLNNYLH